MLKYPPDGWMDKVSKQEKEPGRFLLLYERLHLSHQQEIFLNGR